ncbi:hypothetical protein NC653_022140 [Populus alba x Populus x berolinensis]|uniref:Aminoacyl-tRNA synthetase class Ia domain-containing protein n=1 Tax=Populus alba x Populus x berolinensis TaxID=444605 RepID=A0AAD6QFM1_9ROSI|nr:hypothetical protein NC653_022140 [Populus alba x Populus x berolinensis]
MREISITSSRSNWCISRQRTWGVPLPVFYHLKTKEPLMNEETIDDIKSISSSSWFAMLGKGDDPRFLADLYLEGTDQHHGLFQSSLITSIATKVLDEKGCKMRKSLGNVVDPHAIIEGGRNSKADNAISYNDLPMFDKHTLFQLENVVKTIRESYDYQFFKTFQVNSLLFIFAMQ